MTWNTKWVLTDLFLVQLNNIVTANDTEAAICDILSFIDPGGLLSNCRVHTHFFFSFLFQLIFISQTGGKIINEALAVQGLLILFVFALKWYIALLCFTSFCMHDLYFCKVITCNWWIRKGKAFCGSLEDYNSMHRWLYNICLEKIHKL